MTERARARRVVCTLVAACVAMVPARGVAQGDPQVVPKLRMQFDQYADRQYIFENAPNNKTHTVFEAQLAPRFSLLDKLNSVYDHAGSDSKGGWHSGTAFSFTMLTRIRMTTELSAPVRTPSYMPKVALQYFRGRRGATGARDSNTVVTRTVEVTIGHYSNGQDGCLFANQRRVSPDSDICEDTPGVPKTPLVANRVDGSFSMHYIDVGLFHRSIHLNDKLEPAEPLAASDGYWSIGSRVRYHIPSRVPGGMSPELRDVYGGWRVNLTADRVWWRPKGILNFGPGHMRLEGFVEYLPGVTSQVPSVRGSVELSRAYYERGGWGGFVRYYYGQDYYNLGFLTKLSVVQAGAMIDADRLPLMKPR